jgi:hypothetical protein
MRGRSADLPTGDIVPFDLELAIPNGGRLNSIIDQPDFQIPDYLWFIEVRIDSENVVQQSQIVDEFSGLVAPTGIPWWIVDIEEALRAFNSGELGAPNYSTDDEDGLFGLGVPPVTMDALIWEALYPGFPTSIADNFLSYAFNRNPTDGDTAGGQFPGSSGVSTIDAEDIFTLTFDIVTRANDVTYRVLAADSLPVVPSSPGFEALAEIEGPFNASVGGQSLTGDEGLSSEPNIVSVIDQGYSARVTVKDSQNITASPSRFYRVQVLSALDLFTVATLGAGVTADNLAYDDLDGDGLANIFEILLGSDPDDNGDTAITTPADQFSALQMFYFGVTNPAVNRPLDDADSDGQSNLVELLGSSDPSNAGVTSELSVADAYTLEGMIVFFGANVTTVNNGAQDDLDGDGESNLTELQLSSNPNNASITSGATIADEFVITGLANAGGFNDLAIVTDDADFLAGGDLDGDGESNLAELQLGSNPNNAADTNGATAIEAFVAEGMARFGVLNGVSAVLPANFAPDGDFDIDGESNLVELQLGSNPNSLVILTGRSEVEHRVAEAMATFGVFNGVAGVTTSNLTPSADFDGGGASNIAELVLGDNPDNSLDDQSPAAVNAFVDDFIDTNYAPGAYAPNGDEDADGVTNIQEIFLGTNPLP